MSAAAARAAAGTGVVGGEAGRGARRYGERGAPAAAPHGPELKLALEAARAAALAVHSAAGLAWPLSKVAGRGLRSAEALVRSSLALLASPSEPAVNSAGSVPAGGRSRARRRGRRGRKGNKELKGEVEVAERGMEVVEGEGLRAAGAAGRSSAELSAGRGEPAPQARAGGDPVAAGAASSAAGGGRGLFGLDDYWADGQPAHRLPAGGDGDAGGPSGGGAGGRLEVPAKAFQFPDGSARPTDW